MTIRAVLTEPRFPLILAFMALVVLSPEAMNQVERLPKVVHARILKLVERLKNWPEVSGVKALAGNLTGWYRVRTGDYRVRFFDAGHRQGGPSEGCL